MPSPPPSDDSATGFSRRAPRNSLAGRLLRVIFGCYFGVAALVTAGQLVTEYRSAHRRLQAEIQAMERTFGQGLVDSMWSFNASVLHGILKGIAGMPAVVGVEVRDEHGQTVERIDDPARARRGPDVFDKPFERNFDLVYVDEGGRSHRVGSWTVRSNDGIALDQVRDTLVVILINSVLKTLALWAIVAIVVRRMVERPLIDVSAFVTQLDADSLGARPLPMKAGGSHELNQLAHVFDAMAAKLRRAFDDNAALLRDLKEANATLQARIEERTRDLARLARTDQLTGLGNRRELDECLEREVLRATDGSRFSVVLGDIDHFKSINDRYGHSVGDAVLVAVAEVLCEELRAGDILGRWGGEEFMILCPGTDLETACAVAEEMRRHMQETAIPIVGARTCSLGVAELLAGEKADDMLVRVDEALYTAKRNGRNRVEAAKGIPPFDHCNAA